MNILDLENVVVNDIMIPEMRFTESILIKSHYLFLSKSEVVNTPEYRYFVMR